jgi:hypothetical protein
MSFPGFYAEASIYSARGKYRVAENHTETSATFVHPSFTPAALPVNCRALCGNDPECIYCCRCMQGGGHPRQCCM